MRHEYFVIIDTFSQSGKVLKRRRLLSGAEIGVKIIIIYAQPPAWQEVEVNIPAACLEGVETETPERCQQESVGYEDYGEENNG